MIAGVDVALLVLDEVLGADGYQVLDRVEDGARLQPGQPVLTVQAETRGLLTAERTMLNLICHLSGIATTTAAWVDAVRGTKAKIRDTRKTLPGLRALQKYAVRVGGGVNHRLGLGDAALIKDNHVAAAGSVVDALRAVRDAAPDLPCEVEVDSLEQLDEVLAEEPELILLDNFPVWQTQMAVQRRDARAPAVLLESSGGLSLQNAATYAATGCGLPGRRGADPLGARARHRPGHVGPSAPSNARAAGLAALSAAGSPAIRDRISAPSINEITASATVFASSVGPALGAQPILDRRAPTLEGARRGGAHQRAGVHRLGGDRLDGAAVALVAGQPRHQQVDPAIDDVGHWPAGGQEPAQQLLDVGPGGVDDRGGQLLACPAESGDTANRL